MLTLQDYELNITLDTEINAGELDKKLIDSTIEAVFSVNLDLEEARKKQIENTKTQIAELEKKIEDEETEIKQINKYKEISAKKTFDIKPTPDNYPYNNTIGSFQDSGSWQNETLYRKYIVSLVTKSAFEKERDRVLIKLREDLENILNASEKTEVDGLTTELEVENYYNKINQEVQALQKSMSNVQERFKTLDNVSSNYTELQNKLDEIKRKQNILEIIGDGLTYLKRILIDKDNACYGPVYETIKEDGKWVTVKQLRYSESKTVTDYINEIEQRTKTEIENGTETGLLRTGKINDFKFRDDIPAGTSKEEVFAARDRWKSELVENFFNVYSIKDDVSDVISNIFYYKNISEPLIELFNERIELLNEAKEENKKTLAELEKTLGELENNTNNETSQIPVEDQIKELKNAIIAPENTVVFYTAESVNTDIEIPDDINQAVDDILNDAGTDFVKALKSQSSFNIGLRKQLYLVMSSIQYLPSPEYAIYVYAAGIAAVCMNYFNIGTLSVSIYTPPPIFEIGIKLLGNVYPGLIQCATDIINSNDALAFDPTIQQCDGVSKALGDLFKTDNGNMEVVFGLKGGFFVRPFFGTAKGKSNCVDKIIYIAMLAAYKIMELGARIPESWKQVLDIPKDKKDGNDFLAAFMAAGIKLSLLLGGVKMNDSSRGSTGFGVLIPFAP